MLKKITVLMLIFTVLISTASFASFASIKPMDKDFDYTCDYNGEAFEMAKPYREYYSLSGFHYVSFAKKAGFETTFDEATNRVTSKRGEDLISFVLYEEDITTYINGQVGAVEYANIQTFEGSTYIDSYSLEELFGLNIVIDSDYQSEKTMFHIYIYEMNFLQTIVEEKLSYFLKNFTIFTLPEQFEFEYSNETKFNFDSQTFGIVINGAAAADVKLKRNQDEIYSDITLHPQGIFSLYKFFLASRISYLYKELFDKINFEDPIQLSLYYDGEDLYLKSDFINSFVISNGLSWRVKEEDAKALLENAEGKWLKYEDFEDYFPINSILNNNETTSLAKEIAKIAVDEFGYDGFSEVMRFIDILSDITSENYFKIDAKTNAKTFVFSDIDLKNILSKHSVTILEEYKSLLDTLHFNISYQIGNEKENVLKEISTLQASINNIPMNFKINMGKVGFISSMNSTITVGNTVITKPDLTNCILYDLELEKLNKDPTDEEETKTEEPKSEQAIEE